MMPTPTIMAPMQMKVAGRGRSPRNSQDSRAEKTGLKARMKTRFAVEVLKTALTKVIDPRP